MTRQQIQRMAGIMAAEQFTSVSLEYDTGSILCVNFYGYGREVQYMLSVAGGIISSEEAQRAEDTNG
jgi:hypothetical protein